MFALFFTSCIIRVT